MSPTISTPHQRRSDASFTSPPASTRSTTTASFHPQYQQQPLFAFDVYIHNFHLNSQSYFRDVRKYPLILGFRLWDFPLVYLPVNSAAGKFSSSVSLKKGKSCLFHLPSFKKLHAYLNSFPLYFFLFQEKKLMGSASISLQEMRSHNLAMPQQQNELPMSPSRYSTSAPGQPAFLSILSGKFKLYTMEGFETGSIECDFRLRHVTERNKAAPFQQVQRAAVSSNPDFMVNSFEGTMQTGFVREDTLRSQGSTAKENTQQNRTAAGDTANTQKSSTSASDTHSWAQFRDTREVNDILRLIDLYQSKQQDAKAIKQTLEYTISDMKQQLNVIESALGDKKTKKKKKKKSTRRSRPASATGFTSTLGRSTGVPSRYVTSSRKRTKPRRSTTTMGSRSTYRPSSGRSRTQGGTQKKRILKSKKKLEPYEEDFEPPAVSFKTPSKGISKIQIHSQNKKRTTAKKPSTTNMSSADNHFHVGQVSQHTPKKKDLPQSNRRLSFSSSSSDDDYGKYSAEDFEKDMEKVGDDDFMHDSSEFKETGGMTTTTTLGATTTTTVVDDESSLNESIASESQNGFVDSVTESSEFKVQEAKETKLSPSNVDDEVDIELTESQNFTVQEAHQPTGASKDTNQSTDLDLGEDFLDDFDEELGAEERKNETDNGAAEKEEDLKEESKLDVGISDEFAEDFEGEDLLDEMDDEF